MTGREDKKANDLFFLCSLIEYIGRKTKNHTRDVVNQLGRTKIEKIYDLADVYHSDNIDNVSDSFILSANIKNGDFDCVASAKYAVPTHWDIGKVYKRLILGIADAEKTDVITALFSAYNSFVCEKIEDFTSSFYYENPQYILNSYLYKSLE